MFKQFYDIFSDIQFDKIVELKLNSNFELMKTNKNSKEKEMKINKMIYLLFISEFESKRYDVEIFNQQTFENTIRSNVNLIRLEDSSLLNQQKKSVSAKTSRSDQKSSSFSKINESKTFKKFRFLSIVRTSHDINAKIDQSNILSEKVKRKKVKKQAYAMFLKEVKSD